MIIMGSTWAKRNCCIIFFGIALICFQIVFTQKYRRVFGSYLPSLTVTVEYSTEEFSAVTKSSTGNATIVKSQVIRTSSDDFQALPVDEKHGSLRLSNNDYTTNSSTVNTTIGEQKILQYSNDESQPVSPTDNHEPLEDPYWLDMKIVQFNQTHEELGRLDEIKRLEIDLKDNVTLPFRRHEGGVIVTKVLWPKDIDALKRMLCLQKAAYNRFVNYDIVVFTTLPWTMEQVNDLGRVVAPARLTVTNEGPTLEGHLAEMTDDEIVFLENRCHVNKTQSNLTWFHYCQDGRHTNNLGYSWQAEFRAYHIWTHPALRNYKYMIWLDADALCSKTWINDPVDTMVRQDLVLMWTTFYGTTKSEKFRTKMLNTYGEDLCSNALEDGHMKPKRNCTDKAISFRQVGGFFHVTNLNVYREDRHQEFLKEMVGDYKFGRQWDDQLAVSVIAAMEDPARAWHLRSNNFTLNIYHHNKYDGVERARVANKGKWWREKIRDSWHAGRLLCDYCF